MAEKIFLGLDVPQAVVGLAETVEFCIDRICPALLLKLGNSCQRHLNMCIDQFLTSLDFGEMKSGLRHNVQSSDMGHEACRIHSLAHQVKSFLHVVSVATACTHDMGGSIVDIVEIEGSLEISLARTGEEIETAVLCKDIVSLLHY